MTKIRPFVDFYSEKGLTPTRQDISDIKGHFQRRGALYRHLGIVPSYLKGKSILEFGPGSGHNAVFTATCKPERYVLVDATPSSLQSTKKLLQKHARINKLEVVASDILKFRTKERFDLVLCEGVIPTQINPPKFLQHVASLVGRGGVLVMTCMDSVSLFPEMLRRYTASRIIEGINDFNEQVKILTEYFQPDLACLKGMSRRHEDWVIDQILHPWVGPLFSIPEAIEAIKNNFEIYGVSPNFLTDWRWYKQICGNDFSFNQTGPESYYEQLHNFLDHRYIHLSQPIKRNKKIKVITDYIYARIFAAEQKRRSYSPKEISNDVLRLSQLLPKEASPTIEAFHEYSKNILNTKKMKFHKFCSIWGRGQQYLSFIRS